MIVILLSTSLFQLDSQLLHFILFSLSTFFFQFYLAFLNCILLDSPTSMTLNFGALIHDKKLMKFTVADQARVKSHASSIEII